MVHQKKYVSIVVSEKISLRRLFTNKNFHLIFDSIYILYIEMFVAGISRPSNSVYKANRDRSRSLWIAKGVAERSGRAFVCLDFLHCWWIQSDPYEKAHSCLTKLAPVHFRFGIPEISAMKGICLPSRYSAGQLKRYQIKWLFSPFC